MSRPRSARSTRSSNKVKERGATGRRPTSVNSSRSSTSTGRCERRTPTLIRSSPACSPRSGPAPAQRAPPRLGDPISARCADLFNVSYEVLLQTLERYFAHTEETDAQLATLSHATLGSMLRVLKPLGDLVTTLPVGPDHPGMTAGPSFELCYESDSLMPHREAAWALLEERLRDAVDFCMGIQADADQSLAARLVPIGEV